MLRISFVRRPTLSSVTRGESVTNAGQALAPTGAPIVSTDGEELGAIIGGEHVWARAVSGTVRLGEVSGAWAVQVRVNDVGVDVEQTGANTCNFQTQLLPEKRAQTVSVLISAATPGALLAGTTTLSVTATDWGTDVMKDPDGDEGGDEEEDED